MLTERGGLVPHEEHDQLVVEVRQMFTPIDCQVRHPKRRRDCQLMKSLQGGRGGKERACLGGRSCLCGRDSSFLVEREVDWLQLPCRSSLFCSSVFIIPTMGESVGWVQRRKRREGRGRDGPCRRGLLRRPECRLELCASGWIRKRCRRGPSWALRVRDGRGYGVRG